MGYKHSTVRYMQGHRFFEYLLNFHELVSHTVNSFRMNIMCRYLYLYTYIHIAYGSVSGKTEGTLDLHEVKIKELDTISFEE